MNVAHDPWQMSQAKTPVKPAAARHCWQLPPAGWLKCNVDGAFYAEDGQGATGFLLRNSAGNFIEG
jgi:hypothetical protein